jgi:hypothetical protein
MPEFMTSVILPKILGLAANQSANYLFKAISAANKKPVEKIYWDSFDEAFKHIKPELQKYAKGDGVVTLDQKAFRDRVKDSAVLAGNTGFQSLTAESIKKKIVDEMISCSAVSIGGHQLTPAELRRELEGFYDLALLKFREEIYRGEDVFKKSLIEMIQWHNEEIERLRETTEKVLDNTQKLLSSSERLEQGGAMTQKTQENILSGLREILTMLDENPPQDRETLRMPDDARIEDFFEVRRIQIPREQVFESKEVSEQETQVMFRLWLSFLTKCELEVRDVRLENLIPDTKLTRIEAENTITQIRAAQDREFMPQSVDEVGRLRPFYNIEENTTVEFKISRRFVVTSDYYVGYIAEPFSVKVSLELTSPCWHGTRFMTIYLGLAYTTDTLTIELDREFPSWLF